MNEEMAGVHRKAEVGWAVHSDGEGKAARNSVCLLYTARMRSSGLAKVGGRSLQGSIHKLQSSRRRKLHTPVLIKCQSLIKHLYLDQESDSFAIPLSLTWARLWIRSIGVLDLTVLMSTIYIYSGPYPLPTNFNHHGTLSAWWNYTSLLPPVPSPLILLLFFKKKKC